MNYLRSGPALLLAVTCIMLLRRAATISGQQNLLAQASSVSFTISAEQNGTPLWDELTVIYDVANIGRTPVYVPRGFEATACLNIGPPRISAHFEGRMGPGYGASCSSTPGAPIASLRDRMTKGTVWLLPTEHYGGILQLRTAEALPGPNRVVAVLLGWQSDDFTADEWTDLAKMGSPLVGGELQASALITLTP
jgi:hypothetical protein